MKDNFANKSRGGMINHITKDIVPERCRQRNERISELKMILDKLSGSTLCTEEEAAAARRFWLNGINEGGEGFVPHFWTKDEVEAAKEELERLLAEAGMSNALPGAGS